MKNAKYWIILGISLILFVVITTYYLNKAREKDRQDWAEHDQKMAILDQNLRNLANHIKSVAMLDCKVESDCKTIGLGSKSCGYFQDYLVYSSRSTDELNLIATVEDFNSKAKELSNLSLSITKCGRPSRPARCIASKCTVIER